MKPLTKQIVIILLASAVVAVVFNIVHPRRIPWIGQWDYHVEDRAVKERFKVIPLRVAQDAYRSGEYIFIDARPADEYGEGRIPGAISLPLQELDENLEVLEKILNSQQPSIVYCRNRECDDALTLMLQLREIGKSNLVLYVDGFEIWEESGSPTEDGP